MVIAIILWDAAADVAQGTHVEIACSDHTGDMIVERQCGVERDAEYLQSLGYINCATCDRYRRRQTGSLQTWPRSVEIHVGLVHVRVEKEVIYRKPMFNEPINHLLWFNWIYCICNRFSSFKQIKLKKPWKCMTCFTKRCQIIMNTSKHNMSCDIVVFDW